MNLKKSNLQIIINPFLFWGTLILCLHIYKAKICHVKSAQHTSSLRDKITLSSITYFMAFSKVSAIALSSICLVCDKSKWVKPQTFYSLTGLDIAQTDSLILAACRKKGEDTERKSMRVMRRTRREHGGQSMLTRCWMCREGAVPLRCWMWGRSGDRMKVKWTKARRRGAKGGGWKEVRVGRKGREEEAIQRKERRVN